MRTNPYLILIRPANLITSAADIVAGATVATLLYTESFTVPGHWSGFFFLLLSSVLLYAGGITMNDVIDYRLDQVERPERPIPSGKIPVRHAALFASCLMAGGVLLGFIHHMQSGVLALLIAVLSLVYNKWSKHHSFAGPFNMGVLRGLNLLLGLSFIPNLVVGNYEIGIIPLTYIFAITMVSRGEVHGSSRQPLFIAGGLFLLAEAGILYIGWSYGSTWLPVLFALIHLWFIFPALIRAIKNPTPDHIRRTVMHGVLGIILLDAVWVSTTEYWPWAIALVLLLPVSRQLGRYFSVT